MIVEKEVRTRMESLHRAIYNIDDYEPSSPSELKEILSMIHDLLIKLHQMEGLEQGERNSAFFKEDTE